MNDKELNPVDIQAVCNELSTLTDFMRWGASQFVQAELSYSHGMSSPLDEAVYLVLRSLKTTCRYSRCLLAIQINTKRKTHRYFSFDEKN